MTRWQTIVSTVITMSGLLLLSGCTRERSTEPAVFPSEADVFTDQFASGVTFQAFLGSKYDAITIDAGEAYEGTASLRVIVPDSASVSGTYAGGAFTSNIGRNLTGYNALTFYAKASQPATLNVAGLGNDNTGTSKFTAEVADLPLDTVWRKYIIPIPLSSRLTAEQGLFYFAEGRESGLGYQFWIDEITFENLPVITTPQPVIPSEDITIELGDTVRVGAGTVTFTVNGLPLEVQAAERYFTFLSSADSILSVSQSGIITAVGVGNASLTAKLGTVDASGAVDVVVREIDASPSIPAPTPSRDPDSVVSLFSDVYSNETINTWSADWDIATVEDYVIGTDNIKKYSDLVYAGIEFSNPTIDISSMSHFHMDIWTPGPASGADLIKLKLVDFGANSAYGGGDDSEHELAFGDDVVTAGNWVSIDVQLSAFSGLSGRGHLAQLIVSSTPSTVYVDNIYFYSAEIPTVPTVPAPTPTVVPADVISLFSDSYTDVSVDTWSAVWDSADIENYQIGADNVLKYTNLLFAGVEFTTSPIDATEMTHFHMDVWTPDWTDAPAKFRIKLVDFGANGVWGGGDDVEHELTLDESTMNTAEWVNLDIPLTAFTGLTTQAHLAQLIISGDPNTVFVDNVYFYNAHLPTAPTNSAPTPTINSADVISVLSDAYTNVAVDTWSAVWDIADVSDFVVGSDNMKKYSNLVFAAIELRSAPIDASSMTHFHVDVWTPEPTATPALFRIRLVDFGANGTYGGGDDTQHEIAFNDSVMTTGSWVQIDVALADMPDLTSREHIGQIIISGDLETVFVDNIYFHK